MNAEYADYFIFNYHSFYVGITIRACSMHFLRKEAVAQGYIISSEDHLVKN